MPDKVNKFFWINSIASFICICCCGSPEFFELWLEFFWNEGFGVADGIPCLLVGILLFVWRSLFNSSLSFSRKTSFSVSYLRLPVSTSASIVTGIQYGLLNVAVIFISKVCLLNFSPRFMLLFLILRSIVTSSVHWLVFLFDWMNRLF